MRFLAPDSSEPTLPRPTGRSEQQVAQLFFAGGAAVSLGGVAAYGLLPLALGSGAQTLLVLGCLGVALLFGALLWRGAALPLRVTVQVAAWGGAAMAGVAALCLGSGVHSQVLAYWPLLIAVVAVLAGTRAAAALTAACALATLALAAGEVEHWIALANVPPGEGLFLPLATTALLLGSGLVLGALISLAVRRSLAEASEREQRFRELLSMSVDWYWKLDEELRFVHLQPAAGVGLEAAPDARLGLRPWELSDFGIDEEEMDALRADLESRQAFSQLLIRRTDARGRQRIISCSGRPRFSMSSAFRNF